MVILFLVPYLGLSSALGPLTPIISGQLHTSPQTISLATGLANAGYAFGTILAVQLAQLLPQRRMLIIYASLLVIGSVLAASATGPGMFIAGHILQGLFTSMLLIAAAPPLFLGFPAAKLRFTAVIFNLCIFGAVAAGPLVGGAQASFHGWRPLFWVVAGIAALGLLLSLLTFQDAPPADPSAPRDGLALGLAASGAVAAFWGVSELLTHGFLNLIVIVPTFAGLALIVILWVYQFRAKRPLLTLRSLTGTIPVSGIVAAVFAAAASTSAIALTATVLAPLHSPLDVGLLYVPELGAAVIAAIAFGALFRTRLIHYYVLAGMAFLAAGILVLRADIPPTTTMALAGSGLIGIGIGASVTPALFLVGFSVRSASIQRVFAILELLRAIAAFMIAPILLHFATTLTGTATPAMDTALWICFGLSAGGAIVFVVLYLLGGVRPRAPDLQVWFGGQEGAWPDPPLFDAVRQERGAPAIARRPARVWSRAASGGRVAASLAVHPHLQGDRGAGGGPVLFAYDGSDLAKAAIAEAGHQLPARRHAIVLTVWRTFQVGFVPEPEAQFDAACADDVGQAAQQTAVHGASLAEAAGFRAQPVAAQGTPAWKAIKEAADEHDVSLIVVGARRRAGLGLIAGSVADDVTAHSERPVLVVHDHSGSEPHPAEVSAAAGSPDAADGDHQLPEQRRVPAVEHAARTGAREDRVSGCRSGERDLDGDVRVRVVRRYVVGTVLGAEALDYLSHLGRVGDRSRSRRVLRVLGGEPGHGIVAHVLEPLTVRPGHRKQVHLVALLDEPHGTRVLGAGLPADGGQLYLARALEGFSEVSQSHETLLGIACRAASAPGAAMRGTASPPIDESVRTGHRRPHPPIA
jgi:nucleotide-binding universal stress UspA family protein/MFS family permease